MFLLAWFHLEGRFGFIYIVYYTVDIGKKGGFRAIPLPKIAYIFAQPILGNEFVHF